MNDINKSTPDHQTHINPSKKTFTLQGNTIGVSISESEDMENLGFHEDHVRAMFKEISRYLIAYNAKVAYGGDLRIGGYTRVLMDLITAYRPEVFYENREALIYNYLAWPIYNNENLNDFDLGNLFTFIECDPPENLNESIDIKEFFPPIDLQSRFLWAKSLTKMREMMNERTAARIIIGGKMSKYSGKYPGIIEEIFLAMKKEIPVYLIGAFGGASRSAFELLIGKDTDELSLEKQKKLDDSYFSFYNYYNEKTKEDKSLEVIDYEKLNDFLVKKGIAGLNNGLDQKENIVLLNSENTSEIISLILKGLKNTLN